MLSFERKKAAPHKKCGCIHDFVVQEGPQIRSFHTVLLRSLLYGAVTEILLERTHFEADDSDSYIPLRITYARTAKLTEIGTILANF